MKVCSPQGLGWFSLIGASLFAWGCAGAPGVDDDTAGPADDDDTTHIADDDDSSVADMDSDGDGLTDAEEATLGTDPSEPDTDSDAYGDGVEVTAGTDPLEYYQHPFVGGYPPGPGPVWQGTGWAVGEVLENAALLDQHAEAIDLWSFSGWGLVVVFGAPW